MSGRRESAEAAARAEGAAPAGSVRSDPAQVRGGRDVPLRPADLLQVGGRHHAVAVDVGEEEDQADVGRGPPPRRRW